LYLRLNPIAYPVRSLLITFAIPDSALLKRKWAWTWVPRHNKTCRFQAGW